MGFNQNVIDIITKHCENKSLYVTTRNSVMYGDIKNTDIRISRHDDFNFTVNIEWDYSGFRDTAGLANYILNKIDDALDAHEVKKYDVNSLYPKIMMVPQEDLKPLTDEQVKRHHRLIMNSIYGNHSYGFTLPGRQNGKTMYQSEVWKSIVDARVNKDRVPSIKNVIFNNPATIVFWSDGTKTIVKAQDGDVFDPEKGLAMAISKKTFGNKGNYCEKLKKWLPKEEE